MRWRHGTSCCPAAKWCRRKWTPPRVSRKKVIDIFCTILNNPNSVSIESCSSVAFCEKRLVKYDKSLHDARFYQSKLDKCGLYMFGGI